MTEIIWKCFRCGLIFKDESLADVHMRISRHHVTRVKGLVIWYKSGIKSAESGIWTHELLREGISYWGSWVPLGWPGFDTSARGMTHNRYFLIAISGLIIRIEIWNLQDSSHDSAHETSRVAGDSNLPPHQVLACCSTACPTLHSDDGYGMQALMSRFGHACQTTLNHQAA